MSEPKISIRCLNSSCNTVLKFKKRDLKTKLNCKKCGRGFTTQNGKVVGEPSVVYIDENQLKQERLKQERLERERLERENTKFEEAKNKASRTEKSVIKKRTSSLKKIVIWKVFTISLLVISISLSILLYYSQKDRMLKDKLTTDFLTAFKAMDESCFIESKRYLTYNTQILFDLFIKNQYLTDDDSTTILLNQFVNTLTPLDYHERRKFQFIQTDGTPYSFYLDYVLKNGKYKLDLDMEELTR